MKRPRLPPVLLAILAVIASHSAGSHSAASPRLPLPAAMIVNGETGPRQAAASVPWSPAVRCGLNPTHDKGLHPEALTALRNMAVAHRITQGINNPAAPGNVHYTDGSIKGQPYTGAVDISVRCLTAAQIRALLERLADAGFAAWYRKPGEDGWTGPPHIHGVWAGCALKSVLQQQVRSWLEGRNGLGSNSPYQFWRPSAGMKEKVRTLYRVANPSAPLP